MGKKRDGRKNKQGGPRQKRERKEGDVAAWKDYKRENSTFEAYYKAQNIVPEDDWEAFMAALRRPLPTTFRVTENTAFAAQVKKELKTFSEMSSTVLDDGSIIHPPKNLDWYPQQGGWYYDISRHALKKNPGMKAFTRFLQVQTDAGNISRQEAVSMIPPMLLGVEPHHKVLDMCAAPGSKTGQIIEFLHKDCPAGEVPSGMVIANDADFKRCYTLMHQIQRLRSPCFLITNHDAQRFPWLKVQPADVDLPESANNEGLTKAGKVTFQFDRVLADVPCSGDGTMRKNPDIWDDWSVLKSLGIHKMQLSIAMRGAHLVKVGGRMVYSTCSMSPSEDEAVVAELLRQTKGALRLVDVSDQLPNLKRTAGLSTWKVQDKNGEFYESHEAITDPERAKKIPISAFPPTAQEVAEFKLERCLRLLPHQQDTGGFFVAVLEKVSPTWISIVTEETAAPAPAAPVPAAAAPTKHWEKKAYPEAPFQPFDIENKYKEVWESIKVFYGLKEGFPTDQLMTRSDSAMKVALVSKSVKQIWNADDRKDLKIVNGGVRVFKHQPGKEPLGCEYRIAGEGTQHMLPWISKRRITISLADFAILLTQQDPLFSSFEGRAANTMAATPQGCVLLEIDPSVEKPWGGLSMAAWMAKVSCHFQVAKEDLNMLRLLADQYGLISTEKPQEAKVPAEVTTDGKAEETNMITEEKAEEAGVKVDAKE